MTIGKDILTEASGGKKGTVVVSVRGGGSKARAVITFNVTSITGPHGLTVAALMDEANTLAGEAHKAIQNVTRALEGITVHRDLPQDDEIVVGGSGAGVGLGASVILEMQGENMTIMDLWRKITDALKKDGWRVKS